MASGMEIFKLWGTIEINKNEAVADLNAVDDAAGKTSNKMGTTFKALAKTIGAVSLAIGGIGAALFGLTVKTSNVADEIDKMSIRTGISRERLQELKFVTSQAGVEFSSLQTAVTFLTRSMTGAEAGSERQAKAFQDLGIETVDSAGNMRDATVVFDEVLSALSSMENETERNSIALELFGRGAAELTPLFAAGTDEIQNLSDQAHEFGLVMDDETIAANVKFNDTLDALTKSVGALFMDLSNDLLPYVQQIVDWLLENLPAISDVIGKIIDGIVQVGTAIVDGIGKVADWVSSLVSNIKEGDWTGVYEQMKDVGKKIAGFLGEAVKGAINFSTWIWEAQSKGVKALTQGTGVIKDVLKEALMGQVSEAGEGVDFSSIWDKFKGELGDLLSETDLKGIVEAAVNWGTAVGNFAKDAFMLAFDLVQIIGLLIANAAVLAWNSLLKPLVDSIWNGMKDLWGSVVDFGQMILDGLIGAGEAVLSVGKQLGEWIVEGIKYIFFGGWLVDIFDNLFSRGKSAEEIIAGAMDIANIAEEKTKQLALATEKMREQAKGMETVSGEVAASWIQDFGKVVDEMEKVGILTEKTAEKARNEFTQMAKLLAKESEVAVEEVIESFEFLYEEMVGHSIIPDLVRGIGDWMGPGLNKNMVDPAKKAIEEVLESWKYTLDEAERLFADFFIRAPRQILTGQKNLFSLIGDLVNSLLKSVEDSLIQEFSSFMQSSGPAITPGIAGEASSWLMPMLEKAGAALASSLGMVIEGILAAFGPVGLLVAVIAAKLALAGVVIGKFIKKIDELFGITQRIKDGFQNEIKPAIEQITTPFNELGKVIAKALLPVVKALAPVFEWLANGIMSIVKKIFEFTNSVIKAINWALGWLGVNIPQLDMTAFDTDLNIPDSPGTTGGGHQISEITGPTRDILIDLLSPLASLNSLVGIGNRIAGILDSRLPMMELGFAGEMGVTIGEINLYPQTANIDEITQLTAQEIERKIAESLSRSKRGAGR